MIVAAGEAAPTESVAGGNAVHFVPDEVGSEQTAHLTATTDAQVRVERAALPRRKPAQSATAHQASRPRSQRQAAPAKNAGVVTRWPIPPRFRNPRNAAQRGRSSETAGGSGGAADESPGGPEEVQEEAELPQRITPAEQRPAFQAYKRFYYNNDFRYLNDPNNREFYFGDYFKQVPIGRRSLFDFGGEYRLRDQHENNLRGRNLSGTSDDFLLQRTRFYGNLKLGERIRLYGEALDSATSFQRHTPLPTEENGIEALNLFADGRLYDSDRGELWGRVGRQELAFGNERLVSPAIWNNVLRTFDGAKLFWRGKDWKIDGFWVRPVAFGILPNAFARRDRLDTTQNFYGAYSTYKGFEKQKVDFYYLGLDTYGAPLSPAFPVDSNLQTFGARWMGRQQNFLYEFEGAYQFGLWGAGTQSAGMAVAGLGYELAKAKGKPQAWVYYDWASGDADPANGRHGTFNQLFPWGHRYFGFMDLVGRQNIRDLNGVLTFSPDENVNFSAWYHLFYLDRARDALYNASGNPIRISPTGAAGTYVGQEVDFLVQILVNPRADILIGYSHFFAGSFVKATNPPGVSGNADFYYSQWSWRF